MTAAQGSAFKTRWVPTSSPSNEANPWVPNATDLRFAGAVAGQYGAIQVTSGNTFSIRNVSAAGGRIINSAFTINLLTWDDAGKFTFAGLIVNKTTTTGGRPSAASSGVGAQVYDTTLNKPIWSDGSNWRDAAGTVV
jgi:hypothetical protein